MFGTRMAFLVVGTLMASLVGQAASAQLAPQPPTRWAVMISGKLVGVEQFHVVAPHLPFCAIVHLHAAIGTSVNAFDGTVLTEPAPTGCGFYWPPFWQVFATDLPDSDFDGLPDAVDPFPGLADGDGDGIPDGNEDADADGLVDGQEFWITGTDPAVADSNGNGINDRIDHALATRERQFARIPVIVNLFNGSGASAAHAREAIELANRVLSKARVGFELVRVVEGATAGDDGSGGGTAGDGRFTSEEGNKVSRNGLQEVANLPGRKGFKVNFAAGGGGVLVGSTTPGLSWHRRGSVLCEQRASSKLTAATIAHELFHVLTLAHPAAGSPEDTPGNIMTPSNAGRDDFVNSGDPGKGLDNVSLTPGQIERVIKDDIVPKLGVTGVRRSPAVKKQYESGFGLDAQGDQGAQPSWLDLTEFQASSDEDTEYVHAILSLDGRLPQSGTWGAYYRLLFDSDANSASGSDLAGLPGVDVEVQVLLHHNDSDGLMPSARIRHYPGSTPHILLPLPAVHPVLIRADDDTLPDEVAVDSIELWMDKSQLGLSAADVPLQVLAQPGEFDPVADSMGLVYERTRWQKDPELAIGIEAATRGSEVPFIASGLTPNAAFELRFDDQVLASGVLDAGGSHSGNFTVPQTTQDGPRFLSMVDDGFRFAVTELLVADLIHFDGFE